MKALIAMSVTLGCSWMWLVCVPAQQDGVLEPARKPKVSVSVDTTLFTKPVHANGLVDFARAINTRLREGVNSDNNACIPLYEAIGPHTAQIDLHDYLWGPKQVAAFFEEIDAPDRIYKAGSVLDELRPTQNPYHHFRDYEHPDTRFDEVFRLLHDAAGRDRYYSPLITSGVGDGRPQILAGASYPSDIAIRCAANLLLTRAEAVSDSESAWKDMLASYRLGRLVAMGPDVDDAVLGMQIEQESISAALEFVKRFRPDAAGLRRCRSKLGNMPVRSPVAAKVDLTERCKCLDALLHLAYYGDPTTPNHGYPGTGRGLGEVYNELIRHGIGDPRWDPAFKEINNSYDELVRILNLRKLNERRKALEKLEQQWQATRGSFTPPEQGEFSSIPAWEHTAEYREHMETLAWLRLRVAELMGHGDQPVKGDAKTEVAAMRIAGRAAAAMFQPAYVRAYKAEQRMRQVAHNLEIALALAEYYAVHATYPKQLEDLEPKYLTEIPADVFTGQMPVYRRLKTGYLFYSVGENQRDDDDQDESDDLGVRMENFN